MQFFLDIKLWMLADNPLVPFVLIKSNKKKARNSRERRYKKNKIEKLLQLNLVMYKSQPMHKQEDSHK